jgi:hypothetical protein
MIRIGFGVSAERQPIGTRWDTSRCGVQIAVRPLDPNSVVRSRTHFLASYYWPLGQNLGAHA